MPVPATTVAYPYQALPIVTNMADHEQINAASLAAGDNEVLLAESTNATIEMMQEPEISLEAGMQPDVMVDSLGAIFNKYEVPMGLMNKLMMLSEFESLEFLIDDSGSMSLETDCLNANGKIQTRWREAQMRLKEMVEIIAYVPFQKIDICFLNRRDRKTLTRNGRDPKSFLVDAYRQIDQLFDARGPQGTTPFFEKVQESFAMGYGKNIARYFFGDGLPNGGNHAIKKISQVICNRSNPAGNPYTFLSCTNEDHQVEWMKDVEEVAPYCAEIDDFGDESDEVMRDQGEALPFSRGFYLVCSIVAAQNPNDLDAMDESVPFTKKTLDNLLGIEHSQESYRHYWNYFIKAQKQRVIQADNDRFKKHMAWEPHYQDFLRAPFADQISAVQKFKNHLKTIE